MKAKALISYMYAVTNVISYIYSLDTSGSSVYYFLI